jgi:parvulin-like peptidyl-prolyl isomerase
LENEESYVAFLQQRQLNEDLLLQTLTRPHKVVMYREERWGPRANSLYLQSKERYDSIRYRRLEATDADVMQEVYFRLKSGEESWEALARQFNPGNPDATGLVGPVAVNQVEPELLEKLREAGEGKLLLPLQLGTNTVVAQLEEILPSEFNEELRTLLLRDAFDQWLAEECSRTINKLTFAP